MDAPLKSIEAVPGPGQRLRAARESFKLSIDQVAHHLRLERRFIVDLEADRYENIPSVTFIKGYLRNYSKFVELPADEIITIFDKLCVTEKPLKPITEAFVMKNFSKFDKFHSQGKWLPYLLLIGSAFLILVTYESFSQQSLIQQILRFFHLI